MSSAGDEGRTAASREQIRPLVQEGSDAELASLQLQVSRLAALVEESTKKKEPGSVAADEASSGGWVAATEANNKSPCSRSAVTGDFSCSKREMVGKDYGSYWKAAGPADRERTLLDQPEWARA
ncbi:unnamed protein product [Ectocarpus sp. CCAP 1310/34]|nr:unnamed protein product [Ectocarpus sp. CCAP 1310/34]